jgi:hypothetical protein
MDSIPDGIIWVFVYLILPATQTPAIDSASNRNEYQEYFLGVQTAGADCFEIWEPQPPANRVCPGLYRDLFFTRWIKIDILQFSHNVSQKNIKKIEICHNSFVHPVLFVLRKFSPLESRRTNSCEVSHSVSVYQPSPQITSRF